MTRGSEQVLQLIAVDHDGFERFFRRNGRDAQRTTTVKSMHTIPLLPGSIELDVAQDGAQQVWKVPC